MDAVTAADLLPRILSKLESPWDLARVPSVCKNWQSASSEASPTRLKIAGQEIGDGEGEGVHVQMRQWFQSQLRHGNLKNLTGLQMYAAVGDLRGFGFDLENIKIVQNLFACVLSLMGLLNLQTCRLDGMFSLQDAAMLLPTSIQTLDLCPFRPNRSVPSSVFTRSTHLQALH